MYPLHVPFHVSFRVSMCVPFASSMRVPFACAQCVCHACGFIGGHCTKNCAELKTQGERSAGQPRARAGGPPGDSSPSREETQPQRPDGRRHGLRPTAGAVSIWKMWVGGLFEGRGEHGHPARTVADGRTLSHAIRSSRAYFLMHVAAAPNCCTLLLRYDVKLDGGQIVRIKPPNLAQEPPQYDLKDAFGKKAKSSTSLVQTSHLVCAQTTAHHWQTGLLFVKEKNKQQCPTVCRLRTDPAVCLTPFRGNATSSSFRMTLKYNRCPARVLRLARCWTRPTSRSAGPGRAQRRRPSPRPSASSSSGRPRRWGEKDTRTRAP